MHPSSVFHSKQCFFAPTVSRMQLSNRMCTFTLHWIFRSQRSAFSKSPFQLRKSLHRRCCNKLQAAISFAAVPCIYFCVGFQPISYLTLPFITQRRTETCFVHSTFGDLSSVFVCFSVCFCLNIFSFSNIMKTWKFGNELTMQAYVKGAQALPWYELVPLRISWKLEGHILLIFIC